MAEYCWSRHPHGVSVGSLDVNAVGEAFANIEKRDGCCRPSRVVELAKNRKSPLHGAFEWDDDVAAHKFRLNQARNLIRAVGVVVDGGGAPRVVEAFVHVPAVGDEKAKYLSIEKLQQDPDSYARALNHLFVLVERLEQSVERLQAFAPSSSTELQDVSDAATLFRSAVSKLPPFPEQPEASP